MIAQEVQDVLELSRILNSPGTGDGEAELITALLAWADERTGVVTPAPKAKRGKATESPDSDPEPVFEATADPSEPDF